MASKRLDKTFTKEAFSLRRARPNNVTKNFRVEGLIDHPFDPASSQETLRFLTPHRPRSKRPLVHELVAISIAQLKMWGLLVAGETTRVKLHDGTVVSTALAGKRKAFKYQQGKLIFAIELQSQRLGHGVTWYFVDAQTGKRTRSIRFSPEGKPQKKRPLYPSQFQSKIFRQLLNIDKLILAIDGDYWGRVGPGRGLKKLRNLAELRRLFKEVTAEAAESEREKILDAHVHFKGTLALAQRILKVELAKVCKGWDDFLSLEAAQAATIKSKKPSHKPSTQRNKRTTPKS